MFAKKLSLHVKVEGVYLKFCFANIYNIKNSPNNIVASSWMSLVGYVGLEVQLLHSC